MMFERKIVWITGASSGIGEALAIAFANEGAYLILSGRNESALEAVRAKFPAETKSFILPFDLGQHDYLPVAVDKVLQRFRKVDILINNAGVSQRALAKDTLFEVDKKIMDVNYLGTICLTKALLPSMLREESGHIVTISSLVGKFGSPLRTTYAASKHALHGFFDSLRAEIHQKNVKVMLVCPGFIKTSVSMNALTADGSPQGIMDEATGKGMAPEKLAKKVLSAILKGKEEINIGGKETYAVWVKRHFPGIFSRMIKKAKVT